MSTGKDVLSTPSAKRRMPPVVSDNKDSNIFAHNTEQKVIRKPMEIHPTNIALADGKRLRAVRCIYNAMSQLRVKIISKLPPCDAFVILHDRADIGVNLRMQDDLR